MTSEAWAAWASAAGSWIQAVGSVAAIFWSVRIARQADARATAAEKASDDRAARDERASIARAEAAEAAAFRRPIEEAIQSAHRVRKDLEAMLEKAGSLPDGDYSFTLTTPALAQALKRLPSLADASGPNSALAINAMHDVLREVVASHVSANSRRALQAAYQWRLQAVSAGIGSLTALLEVTPPELTQTSD